MARSAADLDVALRAMAGPDAIMARGYQLNLPEWQGRSLKDLNVAVWRNDEQAPVANEVEARVELVAQALRDAGATVSDEARPAAEAIESYGKAMELDPHDDSHEAKIFRAQVANFRAWSGANESRHKLRWIWHEFFNEYDVLITPIMATAAFEHDHRRFGERTIMVDNDERPYFEQVFWAGLTGVAYLSYPPASMTLDCPSASRSRARNTAT